MMNQESSVANRPITEDGPVSLLEPLSEPLSYGPGIRAQRFAEGTLVQLSARPGDAFVVPPLPPGGRWWAACSTRAWSLVRS